jgi:hypothetical protein
MTTRLRGETMRRLVILASTIVAIALAFPVGASAGLLGVNLVANPGAEDNVGAVNDSTVVAPSSWLTTGNLSAVQYAWSYSPEPTPPTGGGLNFFAGGGASPTATQSVSVSPDAAAIDAGTRQAALSAELGGWRAQDDSGIVTATFLDGAGNPLGDPLQIGPVTAADRNSESKFVPRSATASVPVGTRSIRVVMSTTAPFGYNDAYLDNLSLVLSEVAPAPGTPPTTPPATPPTTPPATPPTININDAITVGAPIPSPAIPATTTIQYNPQTDQLFIRIKYRIREKALKRLCKRGCPATVEIRSRTGQRLYRGLGGLPGDGAVLGSKTGIKIKTTQRKLRIDIPIKKARLLDVDFTTVGGFRVGETRIRVLLRTGLGPALTVRDGRIRVSIARIQSGALPGLEGILAL